MIEVICPKCGSVLTSYVIATYPPINKVSCPHCGWEREDKQNIIRVVMQEPPMQTNADRIRAMSDEKLANQLVSEQYVAMKMVLTLLYQKLKDEEILDEKDAKEGFCDFENEVKKKWGEMVKEKLEWLKAPVEEVDK